MSDWRASPSLEVFTDCVYELNILAQAAADLEDGWPHHIALLGVTAQAGRTNRARRLPGPDRPDPHAGLHAH